MEEQFVTYELALRLKELGFDEPCLGFYESKAGILFLSNRPLPKVLNPECQILAPLWQQAFKWVKDKQGLIEDKLSESYEDQLDVLITIIEEKNP